LPSRVLCSRRGRVDAYKVQIPATQVPTWFPLAQGVVSGLPEQSVGSAVQTPATQIPRKPPPASQDIPAEVLVHPVGRQLGIGV
jgi:hypothetical protein